MVHISILKTMYCYCGLVV